MGNGHAAAGFSAVLAPLLPAVDGAALGLAAIDLAGLALGLAVLAFFFFLAPAFFLPAFFDDFFFLPDALFFFFFFFPPFFAFFFAIFSLLQGC